MNLFQWNELQILTFFLVLVRVTMMMVFLPILGDKTVPPIVKILFGVAMAFVAFPVAWSRGVRVAPSVFDSMTATAWAICIEGFFGMIVGFAARWVFDAVQFAGYFAGTSMGFSIGSVLDPHTETEAIAFAELQYVLAAMLFLALNGHHIYLGAVMDSFSVVKLAGADFFTNSDGIVLYLIRMTAEVLLLALKLSAPVVVVILLMNITFGMMARAVPQMNVLVVSFAANIAVGLLVALIASPGFVNMVETTFDAFLPEMLRFMRLFGG